MLLYAPLKICSLLNLSSKPQFFLYLILQDYISGLFVSFYVKHTGCCN